MDVFDLTPVNINGEFYIKITSDDMLKVITMGVNRVIKSREIGRKRYSKKTGRTELYATPPLPTIVPPPKVQIKPPSPTLVIIPTPATPTPLPPLPFPLLTAPKPPTPPLTITEPKPPTPPIPTPSPPLTVMEPKPPSPIPTNPQAIAAMGATVDKMLDQMKPQSPSQLPPPSPRTLFQQISAPPPGIPWDGDKILINGKLFTSASTPQREKLLNGKLVPLAASPKLLDPMTAAW